MNHRRVTGRWRGGSIRTGSGRGGLVGGFAGGLAGPRAASIVSLLALCLVMVTPARGQLLLDDLPEQAKGSDVVERLGERIASEVMILDHLGNAVTVGDHLDGRKPIVLLLAYYDCPLVCPLVMERLIEALNGIDYTVGIDFDVLVLSFDETNTTEMASRERSLMIERYQRETPDRVKNGFNFHTGSEANVREIADSVGYVYKRIEGTKEFAHPVAVITLTPDGRVSRYIYGFEYPPADIKYSLLEASDGRLVKSLGDFLLHFCYVYDPAAGTYTVQAFRVMQLGAALTVVLLGGLVLWLLFGPRILRSMRRTPREARLTEVTS
ncbi:MAG: SCO family protein [Phycisphaerales bacterium]|nr:SCO family protein [Phycisphaerales bacterium]